MNINKAKLALFATVVSSALLSNYLYAKPPKGEHRKPPEEAITACVDKYEGDTVSFTTHHGHELTGVCTLMEEVLVAVPENRPPRKEKE